MIVSFLQDANLVARLALEAAALLGFAHWGLHLDRRTAVRVGAGIAAPVSAAVVWAMFASPNTDIAVPEVGKVTIQLIVFATATAAMAASGKPCVGAVFAGLAVANTALIAFWGQ